MLDEPSSHGLGFELTEHTADLGVRAWGPRREDVFVQAALGMLSLVLDVGTVEARDRYELVVEAADESLLFAAWLNELLYFVEGRRVVFSGTFEIELGERPGLSGEPYDPARHALRGAVKAATLHRLSLGEVAGGWEGRVLLDV
jgi:SHS2 domain-containing protein